MNRQTVQTVLLAAVLLLWGSASLAAVDAKAGSQPDANTAKKAPAKTKPVDINSASKAELVKLRDIGDAEADSIIKGRPYLSKADLVTRKIIPRGIYEEIKGRIVAVQKPEYLKQKSGSEAAKATANPKKDPADAKK